MIEIMEDHEFPHDDFIRSAMLILPVCVRDSLALCELVRQQRVSCRIILVRGLPCWTFYFHKLDDGGLWVDLVVQQMTHGTHQDYYDATQNLMRLFGASYMRFSVAHQGLMRAYEKWGAKCEGILMTLDYHG